MTTWPKPSVTLSLIRLHKVTLSLSRLHKVIAETQCLTISSSVDMSCKYGFYRIHSIVLLTDYFFRCEHSLENITQPADFFTANVKGGDDISRANWLRENYVPKVYEKQQAELISNQYDRKVAVIADETSDVAGRYVVNILLQPLSFVRLFDV